MTEGNDFTPTYADFLWGNENGEHKMDFNVTVSITDILEKKVARNELVATWIVDDSKSMEVSNLKKIK